MLGEHTLAASVVVPTYNRSRLLRRTLQTLQRQTADRDSFEIVVSDDGSSDDTRAVAAEFAARGPVRYVFQPDEGHRVAAARNGGARVAASDVLIFLDAGTLAGPDFVAAHVAAHRSADPRHPRRAVIGYSYGYNPWQPSRELPKLIDELAPADIVVRLRDDPGFRDMRDETMLEVNDDTGRLHAPWMLFWTMNVSVRASDFWAVGGFYEGFRRWGCEDLELGYRLSTSGVYLMISRAAWAIESPHERDLDDISESIVEHADVLWSRHPVPIIEVYWGIHSVGSHESLETAFAEVAAWRDATAGGRVTDEVSALAEGDPALFAGRLLVVGADRTFVAPAAAADVTVLCPDDADSAPPAGGNVRHAIGLRTTDPDGAFDVVVLTSRLAGLWPRWGTQLRREADRVGQTVVMTTALRDALTHTP